MIPINKTPGPAKKDGTRPTYYRLDYRDRKGKRCRPSFKTRAEAVAKQKEILLSYGAPEALPGYLFQDAAKDYLEICEKVGRNGKPPVDPETVKTYRTIVKLHVVPRVLDQDITNYSPPNIVSFRDELARDATIGAEIKRMAFIHFKGVLQEAHERGKILSNVWTGVKLSLPEKKRDLFEDEGDLVAPIPNRAEAAKLIETARQLRSDPRFLMGWDPKSAAAKPWQKYSPSTGPRGWQDVQKAWARYYPLILVAVFTGMRQGELRGLHWRHVNLKTGEIKVRRAASNAGRIKAPKSNAGIRDLHLPDFVIAELKLWKKLCPVGDLVFPTGTGKVESGSNLYKRCWSRLITAAGIDRGLVFHSLRHYYASTLIAEGFNSKVVQKEMGHADIQTTYNCYGHLFPEDTEGRRIRKQAAADQLLALSVRKGDVIDLTQIRPK